MLSISEKLKLKRKLKRQEKMAKKAVVQRKKRPDEIWIENNPWAVSYRAAKQRCENKNHKRYSWYGGKGIKLLMNISDFKYLWFRDQAYMLERPSIDRIDPDGHYEIKNCRYIELSENATRSRKTKKTHCLRGHPAYIFKKNGLRVCSECMKIHNARFKNKKLLQAQFGGNK